MSIATRVCEVLSASDAQDSARWEALVGSARTPDVYYRPAYVRAYERAGQGKGIALVIGAGQARILVPILLRPLHELPFARGEPGLDATTPYGYGGVLLLSGPAPFTKEDAAGVVKTLREWCLSTGVVSCFLRLHPLLDQEHLLGWAKHEENGLVLCYHVPTTAVNLTDWDQHAGRIRSMNATRRRHLNLARRRLRLTWHSNGTAHGEALRAFEGLYRQTMNRHRADSFYFFSGDYFAALAEGLGDRFALALAWLDDEPVGANIFLADGSHAHYHLGAANEVGLKSHASTLLLNAGAAWAVQHGAKLLHLGGGTRGADSLFQYKRSYGGPIFTYSAYGFIVDESRYTALVERRLASLNQPPLRDGYFPAYRA